jgi:hypothetical protein
MFLNLHRLFSTNPLDSHQHLEEQISHGEGRAFRDNGREVLVPDTVVYTRLRETGFEVVECAGIDLGVWDYCEGTVLPLAEVWMGEFGCARFIPCGVWRGF